MSPLQCHHCGRPAVTARADHRVGGMTATGADAPPVVVNRATTTAACAAHGERMAWTQGRK